MRKTYFLAPKLGVDLYTGYYSTSGLNFFLNQFILFLNKKTFLNKKIDFSSPFVFP